MHNLFIVPKASRIYYIHIIYIHLTSYSLNASIDLDKCIVGGVVLIRRIS